MCQGVSARSHLVKAVRTHDADPHLCSACFLQTMVAGGVVSIAMFIWVATATFPSAAALVPFAALTTAVVTHMPFSVGFHLFRGIDADVYNLWRRWARSGSSASKEGRQGRRSEILGCVCSWLCEPFLCTVSRLSSPGTHVDAVLTTAPRLFAGSVDHDSRVGWCTATEGACS